MMKTVWIWNHYASRLLVEPSGRHYYFAKYLKKAGYNPIIFCASTVHSSQEVLDVDKVYSKRVIDGISVIVVKTRSYTGNGRKRILNMVDYYRNVQKAAKEIAVLDGLPSIVYASSVHPLTLVAGEKTAKGLGVPCVCEVRDLWPASLIAYGMINEKGLLARILYRCEHRIYKRADALIFTFGGGKCYITDKKWDKQIHCGDIDLDKVFHVNNGVDLESFDINRATFQIVDEDLDNKETFKCIYTGSIRTVNRIDQLVDVAQCLQGKKGAKNIKVLIYGRGDKELELKNRVRAEGLQNVVFKGFVEKKYIPYVLSKGDLLLMHVSTSHEVDCISKYGQSLNKSFDYLAAGKPILNVYSGSPEHDYIEANGAGISQVFRNSEEYAATILDYAYLENEEYEGCCLNARKTAEEQYNYPVLTEKLMSMFDYASHK